MKNKNSSSLTGVLSRLGFVSYIVVTSVLCILFVQYTYACNVGHMDLASTIWSWFVGIIFGAIMELAFPLWTVSCFLDWISNVVDARGKVKGYLYIFSVIGLYLISALGMYVVFYFSDIGKNPVSWLLSGVFGFFICFFLLALLKGLYWLGRGFVWLCKWIRYGDSDS